MNLSYLFSKICLIMYFSLPISISSVLRIHNKETIETKMLLSFAYFYSIFIEIEGLVSKMYVILVHKVAKYVSFSGGNPVSL